MDKTVRIDVMYHVGVTEIDLRLPTAHNLKERRSLLKGQIERARDRFNVSLIEADGNNSWHSATIIAVSVSSESDTVREMLESVALHFEVADGLEILGNRIEML